MPFRALALGGFLAWGMPIAAQTVLFEAPGAPQDLAEQLRKAAGVIALVEQGSATPGDLIAASQADYRGLLRTLYATGHYGGTISIRLDGREASALSAFETPSRISEVALTVRPGPQFTFSRTAIGPLAPETVLPEGFAPGQPARAAIIGEAAKAAVSGWRDQGHAKARLDGQQVVANHPQSSLAVDLGVEPGPVLRFGTLTVTGAQRSNPERLAEIAGLPQGKTFSPADTTEVARRLRDTGAFSSVSVTEAETANPDGSLDITAQLAEAPLRRIGGGAEIVSDEGISLSGFWMHRNVFGGAERFRVEGEIAGIGADLQGLDYALGASFSRPGTLGVDTTLELHFNLSKTDAPNRITESLTVGARLDRRMTDALTLGVGIDYMASRNDLKPGVTDHRALAFPLRLGFDTRNSPTDPTTGLFAQSEVRPYIGRADTDNGLRTTLDMRGYRRVGDTGPVLAARGQIGAIFGSGLLSTPPDDLFYSGGGGTVRGQPFESLGTTASGRLTGGRSFVAFSFEARIPVTGSIGMVAFYDTGFVGSDSLPGSSGSWHSGYGVGLRYGTPVGPIRLDVGFPAGGGTSPKFYFGLGQAF